ncbi:LacI family DNA-binding transcriptional regulator [Bacillus songklensis]|uniref:LacI family DNA-binding transcriptional regulator n=1 Tax=Bacillus songklensis TaxID=1069116 RepID=A0ABV8B3F8_9BACI
MITIKEIAKMANVSSTTVSRVLNNSGYVSDPVRQRILNVIKETGYVPSEHAKSLRTKKTKVIGVVLPRMGTETSSRLINGMSEELAKHEYQILLANTNLEREKEIVYLRLLKSRQVDGIVLLATNINEELLSEIKQLNIPFVAVGQDIPGVSTVVNDDYHAAKEIIKLFVEKGHSKIAFIGVDESDRSVGYLRKQGYLDAMEDYKLPVEKEWVQKGIFNIESGYEAMKRIMEKSFIAPTAVFAVTDRLAVGAMRYLKENGYSIPQEMALVGIGASELSMYVTPSLTTIDFLYERAGKEVASLILQQISGKDTGQKKIQLNYRLLVRDSI